MSSTESDTVLRTGLALTAVLATTLLTAGCGSQSDSASSASASASASSGSSAPTDAKTSDFCSALTSTTVKNGKDVAKVAAAMEKTGTPSDISAKQRLGFEAYLSVLESIDESTTKKQLNAMTDLGLSTKQEKQVRAFLVYASSACS
ncbi:MAG: hypothetical protein QM638_00590 [Nocardioides sp.]|uniref:hypothetical protein n=1 Tax=Nocardioides sp. TaxID=35761 RepID=UPI0039E385FC